MTHNEERAHWVKEGAIGLGVGVLYGVTNTCVGHPWDTLKTKMQGQAGFEKVGMVQTFTKTIKTQGVIGLYRGCIPPLWGSGIYRSTQFAVFEGMYTFMDSPVGRYEVPGSAGVQLRVLGAGAIASTSRAIIVLYSILRCRDLSEGCIASTSRAIIETPLEYAKIRGQTQQKWKLRQVYTGFGVTWCRTMGLMCTYFILVDSGRRHFPEQFKRPLLGPFLASGIAATLAWWIVWPMEYMKCQVQAGYGDQNVSVIKRMRLIMKERGGFFALYRGIMPGSIRSFLANGTSMIVMQYAQRKVSELGLRD